MATTPEGKVKKMVSDLLKAQSGCYYFMPVQAGFGSSTLDYLGCLRGRFFAIETKAPGKKPTNRQTQIMGMMKLADATIFVIDGPESLIALEEWIDMVQAAVSP